MALSLNSSLRRIQLSQNPNMWGSFEQRQRRHYLLSQIKSNLQIKLDLERNGLTFLSQNKWSVWIFCESSQKRPNICLNLPETKLIFIWYSRRQNICMNLALLNLIVSIFLCQSFRPTSVFHLFRVIPKALWIAIVSILSTMNSNERRSTKKVNSFKI